jgi:hypothetical protein
LQRRLQPAFFVSPASIANWEPQQLIEYTLGAAPQNPKVVNPATDPFYLWVPNNVDYDVSNIDFAFMSAAIEPYGNSLIGSCCAIGWAGLTATIDDVDTALDDWRASPLGMNWPFYVDQSSTTDPKATVPRKVPSALEIFLNYNSFNNTSNYSPAPSQSRGDSWRVEQCRELSDNAGGQQTPALHFQTKGVPDRLSDTSGRTEGLA